MCFNGNPKIVYVTVKGDNIWENFYDINFKYVPINHGKPRYKKEFIKPPNFNEMIKIVKKLSKGMSFIRIDLHNVDGKIYFGEYTFYDWAGLVPFITKEWDDILGEWINLKE